MPLMLPLSAALALCAVGIVVFIVSSVQMSRRLDGEKDPLRAEALPTAARKAIDLAILLRDPPDDTKELELARKRAEYVVRTDPVRLRWMTPVFLSIVLALCGFEAIPVASIVVAAIQLLLLFIWINYMVSGWRMVRFCREFIRNVNA